MYKNVESFAVRAQEVGRQNLFFTSFILQKRPKKHVSCSKKGLICS